MSTKQSLGGTNLSSSSRPQGPFKIVGHNRPTIIRPTNTPEKQALPESSTPCHYDLDVKWKLNAYSFPILNFEKK